MSVSQRRRSEEEEAEADADGGIIQSAKGRRRKPTNVTGRNLSQSNGNKLIDRSLQPRANDKMHLPSTMFALLSLALPARAAVPCEDDGVCEERLWRGSRCRNGFCTNPFEGGCLRSLLEDEAHSKIYDGEADGDFSDGGVDTGAWRRRLLNVPRTCNSEDPPDAAERGLCSPNANDYPEVRIWAQNWESAFVVSWMMQIIYSELLGVPSTIETGVPGLNVNFYDETNRMDYGIANEYAMFQHAYDAPGGDCAVYAEANRGATGDDYVPCAHAVMDVWASNSELRDAQKRGVAEPGQFVGTVAFQGWHVTQSSLVRDSSLATIFGIAGEANRRKLAKTFKRPTTWGHYCTLISRSNCTIPDDVAKHPPAEDGSEDGKYFAPGSYTGWFRATDKNDCNKTEECTGHFMEYPCGWSSYAKQQIKHLGIALESDGKGGNVGAYTYTEMVEIWNAANATKSDLIGIWWTPDATANSFKGSGSDLISVKLPDASQECVEHRVDPLMRCAEDATEFDIYGDARGACGEPSTLTEKIAVGNLRTVSEASGSPAYDAYRDFALSELHVNEILTEWTSRGGDDPGFDLRRAVCGWMGANLDDVVRRVVPPTHPRTFARASETTPLSVVSLVSSGVAILLTIGTAGGLGHQRRQGNLDRGAQVEFLGLLLAGLFLVSVGCLLLGLKPSKGTCVGSMWMINIGYATQLVPTMIRVSAIIKIVRASRKMKIVKVDKKKLLTRSIGFSAIAGLYCMLWTIFDPPRSHMSLSVSEDKNDFGETIVLVSNSCDTNSPVWYFVSYSCQAFLLIGASVLAYQMRSVPNSVNDSAELAVMIYSSFIFLILRIIGYAVAGAAPVGKKSLQKTRSLLCSLDTIANIIIFFRRFFEEKKQEKERRFSMLVRQAGFRHAQETMLVNFDLFVQQSGQFIQKLSQKSMRLVRKDSMIEHGSQKSTKFAKTVSMKSSRSNGLKSPNGSHDACDTSRVGEARRVLPSRLLGAQSDRWSSASLPTGGILGPSDESEVSVEEEKEEEDSEMIRFKMKDRLISFPKWALEEYGQIEKLK